MIIQPEHVYLARGAKHERNWTINSLQVQLFDMKADQHTLENQTDLTFGSGVWVHPACCKW